MQNHVKGDGKLKGEVGTTHNIIASNETEYFGVLRLTQKN